MVCNLNTVRLSDFTVGGGPMKIPHAFQVRVKAFLEFFKEKLFSMVLIWLLFSSSRRDTQIS